MRLGIFSSEQRRLRDDQIEVFEIMWGIDMADIMQVFHTVEISETTGQMFRVTGKKF